MEAIINEASLTLSRNSSLTLSSPNKLISTFIPKCSPLKTNTRPFLFPSLRRHHRVTASLLSSPLTHSFPDDAAAARKGSDILAEALHREGVRHVFGYPGDSSMEILDALRRRTPIRNVLARHEQGSIFAAEGYARASGFPGVCITTSGPGATNLVTGLADALADSVPLVVVTGQISSHLIGTGALQDTPIVELTRPITKKNYFVSRVEEIPAIVKEAFFVAKTRRPGPVLIDLPKDVQMSKMAWNWDEPLRLGVEERLLHSLPEPPSEALLAKIVDMIIESRRPVLYVGGGCLDSSKELRRFVELSGIPVASTMMALGTYPCSDEEFSLQMLGLYGTDHANYAVNNCDLLLAFGTRFNCTYVAADKESFASQARIVHINIDPSELVKNKNVAMSLCADIKLALKGMNSMLTGREKPDFSTWRREINARKHGSNYRIMCAGYCRDRDRFDDVIHPWHVIQVLDELTNGNAIICTGAGEHQVWATQFYTHEHPRHVVMSGGFGPMGFGLPAAIGAAIARPDAVVVDVDGDGSFLLNVQELATARAENLSLKILIFNNQHFGMTATWEDRCCRSNRVFSYLGNPFKPSVIFPDMVKFAEACDVPSARVATRNELRDAMKKMMETPGPYLLDVIVPLEDHAFPSDIGGP
ncbi:acetolactate synthase 2, chloroplastic-like [Andrographis paniculata]|uniref:acetolactate synthase 2, chloroplastic-like n=1 Tax=Andrographis paniculata TaxID=175694 RepID=UPI0021E8A9E3|nr:acetolactate synthase 2, chloroplastic-like [Andrographis paniculata]